MLSDDQVWEIHTMYQAGMPVADIARKFGISTPYVHRIVKGDHYKEIYALYYPKKKVREVTK